MKKVVQILKISSLMDIFLEGGYGTMEELLEMITWSQLGIHNKPIRRLFSFSSHNLKQLLCPNAVTKTH